MSEVVLIQLHDGSFARLEQDAQTMRRLILAVPTDRGVLADVRISAAVEPLPVEGYQVVDSHQFWQQITQASQAQARQAEQAPTTAGITRKVNDG